MQKNRSSRKFPLVGLGASAGGLEALFRFFEAMPAQSGMAFVVVQHLSPDKDSLLPELLQKHSPLKVQEIKDQMLIRREQLYVLPPGYELRIQGKRFYLSQPSRSKGWPQGINRFFESLANAWGQQAAAVILSGAGNDGTEGAQRIRECEGLVIAQKLETASYNSMPSAVIDAGLATKILPPEAMPAYLIEYFANRPFASAGLTLSSEAITDEFLQEVIQALQQQSGRDFSGYRLGTLQRQITYRMAAQQVESPAAYLTLLQQGSEANQLLKGLLIHVTAFFRDPAAFEALKTKALLPLLQSLSSEEIFRVWVPGCASGEEAISLAILISECLDELKIEEMTVRIFATDTDADSIQRARRAIYPKKIASQLSPERLERHFILSEQGYQAAEHLRQMLIWGEHNLIENPPFSRLHLISCRNVLIYFQPELQEKIRLMFQMALQPQGILFLGSAESMPHFWELFSVVDSKHRIYRRTSRRSPEWTRLDQPWFGKLPQGGKELIPTMLSPKQIDDQYLTMIQEVLLQHYAFDCLIVDEDYQLCYRYGDLDRYLRLVSGGNTQQNVLAMAREGLQSELSLVLYNAFESELSLVREGIRFESHGEVVFLRLIVAPLRETQAGKKSRLIIFEAEAADKPFENTAHDYKAITADDALLKLREDLKQAHQALHIATGKLQSKDQELSAAREQIETHSEELRSSQEELVSLNEELTTLNAQLTYQNKELNQNNAILYNLLQSSTIAMIFLDLQLALREWTRTGSQIFHLRREDIGRPRPPFGIRPKIGHGCSKGSDLQ